MAVKIGNQSAGQSAATQQPATPRIPFPRASRLKTNLSFSLGPITVGASAVPFGPIQIPANGYLRALNLEFNVSTTGNAATVALAATNDAPFSHIQQISVTTSSGDALIVPIDGYAMAMVQKYGVFGQEAPFSDPRADPTFTGPSIGAGATAGSSLFRLRIPFEIDASTGFGALPNLAANRSYYVQGIFNALATVFSTPPNGTTTITVLATAEYWSVPNDTNAQGDPQETAPVGNGSFSVIQSETIPVNAGTGIYQMHNVGNVVRSLILIYRDGTNTRIADASSPGIFELVLNNDLLFYQTRNEFKRQIANNGFGAAYGAVAAAQNTAQGQDAGVWPFTQFLAPGQATARHDGPRNQYLPTLDATLLQIRGTSWGTTGTLQVITNSIVPTSAAALYQPHIY
jgi:hypothetical protein